MAHSRGHPTACQRGERGAAKENEVAEKALHSPNPTVRRAVYWEPRVLKGVHSRRDELGPPRRHGAGRQYLGAQFKFPRGRATSPETETVGGAAVLSFAGTAPDRYQRHPRGSPPSQSSVRLCHPLEMAANPL